MTDIHLNPKCGAVFRASLLHLDAFAKLAAPRFPKLKPTLRIGRFLMGYRLALYGVTGVGAVLGVARYPVMVFFAAVNTTTS